VGEPFAIEAARVAMLLDEKLTVLRACSRRWRVASAFSLSIMAVGLSLVTLTPAETLVAEVEAEKKEETTKKPAAESTIGVHLPGRILIGARLDTMIEAGDVTPYGFISVEPNSGAWTKLFDLPNGAGIPTFSIDGRHCFFQYFDGQRRGVLMIDTDGQSEPKHVSDQWGYLSCNPNRDELIISDRHPKSIRKSEEKDGEKPAASGQFTLTPVYTPSGHWRINLDDGTEETLDIPEEFRIEGWSPDGDWLVATSWLTELPGYGDLYLMRSDGSERRKLTNQGGGCNEPRFSSDGKYVVYCGSSRDKEKGIYRASVRIIEIATQTDHELISFDNKMKDETLEPPYTWYYHPTWSPDNHWLAVVYARRKTSMDYKSQENGVLLISRDGSKRKELKLKQGADLHIGLRPYWK
jgi:hypothetical protein